MTSAQHIEVGLIQEDELEQAMAIIGQALINPSERMRRWLTTIGIPYLRAARVQGQMVAALGILPMGQWFGGNSVPVWGITAVGVAPPSRGTGVGVTLLRRTLEEQHAAGVPLAALYPATVTFYRRNGYERAATRTIYELPLEAIVVRERTLTVAEVGSDGYDQIRQLYTQRAQVSAGHLDRHPMLWDRLFDPHENPTHKYMVLRDGQPEGYIIFSQSGWDDPLNVHDICALSQAAGQRLLALIADHRSVLKLVRWCGAPVDPLNYLIPEHRHTVQWTLDLMLRIVDVAGALTARGYPPGLEAELHLEVRDDLLPWNNGRFVLSVVDGHPQVRPGGEGRMRLDVRELASMYSGYYTPVELQLVGALDASAPDLAMASLLFSGPRPWLPDMF